MISSVLVKLVEPYFRKLQGDICSGILQMDLDGFFNHHVWDREEGGGGRTSTLKNGQIFEKAGVGFSLVGGSKLPSAATLGRPQLSGGAWAAVGVSVVIHPKNPYVPTSHANVRFFVTEKKNGEHCWWFGGGFDLTPFYVDESDCIFWHSAAREILKPYGSRYYTEYKTACDSYFYLPHRQETRGIGGIFFDDLNELGFDKSFALTQAVGGGFMKAYLPIVKRHFDKAYGPRERAFQLIRRGRYVEFNLVCDRGTLFGLQSGGRTASILMSMPPLVSWDEEASFMGPDESALEQYLSAREWL